MGIDICRATLSNGYFKLSGRATTRRCKFKALSLQKFKKWKTSKNIGFTKKSFEDFKRKKIIKKYSRPLWNGPVEHRGPKIKISTWALQPKRKKTKDSLKEAFRIKLQKQNFCKTPTKASILDKFNFWVVLLDHGMFTNTTSATTFRPRFLAPLVCPHYRGNMLWNSPNPLSKKIEWL